MIAYAIYTIITLICIHYHICSFILRFSYFSIIHIFLYFYHAYIYSFIYSYMPIELHITVLIFLYNTYIPIFFSCIHLLVHIFLYFYHACIYSFIYSYILIIHVQVLIPVLCHLLLISIILSISAFLSCVPSMFNLFI